MGIDPQILAGFLAGLLLFGGMVVGIATMVREMLKGEGGQVKGLRLLLMIAGFLVKSLGTGFGVWLILFHWKLPLPALAAGLFAGLLFFVVGLSWSMRSGLKKKMKKH